MGNWPARGKPRRLAVLIAVFTLFLVLAGAQALAEQGTGGLPLPPAPLSSDDSGHAGGSTDGYPNATPAQAEQLFTSQFSDAVKSLAIDPPDLEGLHPAYLDDNTAVISPVGESDFASQMQSILDRDRHDLEAARADLRALFDAQDTRGADSSQIVSSALPLRVNDGQGDSPIDLALDRQGPDYTPQNPLVDLTLPVSLEDPVSIGNTALKLEVGATEPATASRMSGDNLFYADAAPATDVVLAPITSGLEAIYQLRAPESPDRLDMSFDLPDSAQLQGTSDGGAMITKDGQALATVLPPAAEDAAGNPVPMTMSVHPGSGTLGLNVPHDDPGINYPISVDPTVVDSYTWAANGLGVFADWAQKQTSGSPYLLRRTCVPDLTCTSGTGLYAWAPPNQTVASDSWGAWEYSVPNYQATNAYISELDLGPMHFNPRTDGSAGNPYMFAGIWSNATNNYLASNGQSTAAGGLYWSLTPPPGVMSGKIARFGLSSGVTRQPLAYRDAYAGGASVYLGDADPPTISNVSYSGITVSGGYSNWVDNATPSATVTAQDNGLGVKKITGPGSDGTAVLDENCDGTHASPCPQRPDPHAFSFDTSAPHMQSGVTTKTISAMDALAKFAAPVTFGLRVDHDPPTLTLSGGLAPNPSGSAYRLDVTASDGNSASQAQWQSGVREVSAYVNNNLIAHAGPQDCPATAGSCSLSVGNTIAPSDYPPDSSGNLHLKVVATDQMPGPGHTQQQTWDVPIPDATIDSGPSGPTNNPTPQFTYHSSVSGSSFECHIDGDTFHSCDASGFTAPHLADGPHLFEVRAIDQAGHVDQSPAPRNFTVDTQAPNASIDSGPSGPTNNARPTFAFSSPDGSAAFTCSIDTGTADFRDCSGAGTHQPASNLADGSYTFRVKATDPAGNSTTATRTFSVDTQAPGVSVDSGPSGVTTNPRPTFGFSSPDGSASFTCSIDTGTAGFNACSGASTHQPASNLADGPYTFRAKATDPAGNANTATRDFIVDTGPPDTTIDSPPNGSTTSSSTPKFTYHSSENGSTFECRVDGAAFSSCSAAAGYRPQPLNDGQHTVDVRAVDAAGNRDASPATRTFTVAAHQLPPTILDDTTWTAGAPYTGSSVTIPAGVTVTVQPGAKVQLSGSLTVSGTLDVEGTGQDPAIFTSSQDSAPGQWSGIALWSSTSVLNHAEVRYAGNVSEGAVTVNASSPRITNSTIKRSITSGIYVTGNYAVTTAPEIANNTIVDNSGNSIVDGGIAYDGYNCSSCQFQVNVHDNDVERNAGYGVFVGRGAHFIGVSLANNTIKDNANYAISYGGSIPSDIDQNTLSGNRFNAAYVSGTVDQSMTWNDHGYPLVADVISIAQSATLTLDPGLVIKETATACCSGSWGGDGVINAEGTAANPVILTSLKDDSAGGDTNGDGAATQPAPGQWNGITLWSSGSILNHAEVRYAGASSGGTVMVTASSPTITNSTIKKSLTSGIYVTGHYGITTAPEIANNTIVDNDGNNSIVDGGIVYYGYNCSSCQFRVNVHDNDVERNASYGVFVGGGALFTGVSLANNTIKDNANYAISYGGSIPSDIDQNTLSGNRFNAAYVSGTVDQSMTWADHGYPFVLNLITVSQGATLTLSPGFILKGTAGSLMSVNGTLNADGTAANPVIFTSYRDDLIGGDTNGDSNSTQPQPGDWGGIQITNATAGDALTGTVFRYASTAIAVGFLDLLPVTNSEFAYNRAAFTVASTAHQNPSFAALPCVPPYLSFIYATTDWFGASGVPGAAINLAPYGGLVVPDELSPLYSLMSSLYSANAYLSDNTVPWTLYSCLGVSFPVTPVLFRVSPDPQSEPYPQYGEH
jgi:hypothetical protein